MNPEIISSDLLDPLADIVCELEQKRGVTPVLVSDDRVVLADDFYVGLCLAVSKRSGRSVRLDILPGHRLSPTGRVYRCVAGQAIGPWLPAAMASVIFAPLRRRAICRLSRHLPTGSRIESTVAVSRPGGSLRELVIGLAGPTDELPSFAEEVFFDMGLARQAA
ncbi:MAG TPA: hypothetical protein DDZ51_29495 [Planctomycetaceae bacterium]|nr:hypothetical protein [Planctomycetaceae bacterium]